MKKISKIYKKIFMITFQASINQFNNINQKLLNSWKMKMILMKVLM